MYYTSYFIVVTYIYIKLSATLDLRIKIIRNGNLLCYTKFMYIITWRNLLIC